MSIKVSDDDFIAAMKELGSPTAVAEHLNLDLRSVYQRRKSLEQRYGTALPSYNARQKVVRDAADELLIHDGKRIIDATFTNATVLVASDCHYWPGEPTLAHKAFVKACEELKPEAIILNGDVFDGARVSRHDPLYKNNPPSVNDEINVCVERLGEIEKASHNSKLFWLYGNHDTRMWRYIRMNAPEMESVPGTDIFDYFPGWNRAYVMHINENTVVKHRWHNGIHAVYNNTLKGGRNIVTGHLHRLCVTPWGDYNGRRYGVDSGTLADPSGEQFAYLEGAPTPWAAGFVVLTFNEVGDLLPPEICEVRNDKAYFRGGEVL